MIGLQNGIEKKSRLTGIDLIKRTLPCCSESRGFYVLNVGLKVINLDLSQLKDLIRYR